MAIDGVVGFLPITRARAAHTRMVAAWLLHEAAHCALFRSTDTNQRVGEVTGWICGAAWASFNRIRPMPLRGQGLTFADDSINLEI